MKSFVEDLHMAIYASFLMAFAQGLRLIKKANKEHGWGLDFISITQPRRGGRITQFDYIIDLLEKVYRRNDDDDLLGNKEIGDELRKAFPSLKKVVLSHQSQCKYPKPEHIAGILQVLQINGPADPVHGSGARLL
jgi:6-phosphogluconate dehydrogenase